MAKRLKKLRISEVSLCRKGMNRHAEINLWKSQPEPEPEPVDMAKALRDASPEAIELFNKQIEGQKAWLENFQKSQSPKDPNMTNADPNHHFNKAVADYAARHDLPISKAAVDILSARPDLVEAAYTRDGQTAVAREQAKMSKLYGGAA